MQLDPSKDPVGTVAGRCPNCGAPIDELGQSRCRYCDTVLPSTAPVGSPPEHALDEAAFNAQMAALDADLDRRRKANRRLRRQLTRFRTCGCLALVGIPLLVIWGLASLLQPRHADTKGCAPQPCASIDGVSINVKAANRPPLPPGQDARYFSDWRVFLTLNIRNDSKSSKDLRLNDLQVGYADQDPGAWGHPDSSSYFAGCNSNGYDTWTLGPGKEESRTICFDSYQPKDSLALYWQTSLYGKTKILIPGAH